MQNTASEKGPQQGALTSLPTPGQLSEKCAQGKARGSAARAPKLESQTYGPRAVDDGRDRGERLCIALQALMSSLGRENGVGRPNPRGSTRTGLGLTWGKAATGAWSREERGCQWQILKSFEDLLYQNLCASGRGCRVLDLETPGPDQMPRVIPDSGGQPAYQVSRDRSGDERVRAVDQGPTDDQHYWGSDKDSWLGMRGHLQPQPQSR